MKTIKDVEKQLDAMFCDECKSDVPHEIIHCKAWRADFLRAFLHSAIKTAFEETMIEKKDENVWATGGWIEGREHNIALSEVKKRQDEFLN